MITYFTINNAGIYEEVLKYALGGLMVSCSLSREISCVLFLRLGQVYLAVTAQFALSICDRRISHSSSSQARLV